MARGVARTFTWHKKYSYIEILRYLCRLHRTTFLISLVFSEIDPLEAPRLAIGTMNSGQARNSTRFYVNGKQVIVGNEVPMVTTLNAYLRYQLGLSGTKAMCHEGGCGSCIVTVTAPHPLTSELHTFSVNSCLVLIFCCDGWAITTIEGIGDRLRGYHPIQTRLKDFNGTQCGYCSPGWVMQMYSLMGEHRSMQELERSFGSNTCRCTGYRPILDTMKSFAADASPELLSRIPDIEDLHTAKCPPTVDPKTCNKKCIHRYSVDSDSDWCVVASDKLRKDSIEIDFHNHVFFKVYDIESIFGILDRNQQEQYMLVNGNTGRGVFENFEYPKVIIDISEVQELKNYYIDQNLIVGANMTLEDARRTFETVASTHKEFSYMNQLANHFELIAHIPVRNIGTLAGNLMVKHMMPTFQSDVFLLFETIGALLTIKTKHDQQLINMTKFLETDMNGAVIYNIILPPLEDNSYFHSYKIMPRNQNAHAIVNAGFLMQINTETSKVIDASIVYGGISGSFVHAERTEQFLVGKSLWEENDTLSEAMRVLESEVQAVDDPPEPAPQCRNKLAIGLFYKFVLSITPVANLDSRFISGSRILDRPISNGSQNFQTDSTKYPLNQPLPKLEGLIQTAGEAQYVNDIPQLPNEVFGAFVLSTIHSGEIHSISTKDVLNIEGVHALYTAKDIPGKNSFTRPGLQLITEDEEILASSKILFYGQPIAIVVANSERLAAEAAKKVKVFYKDISENKPVLTIDQAKQDKNRVAPNDSLTPSGTGTNVKKIVKGIYNIHGQYHYTLEVQTCVVIPVDRGLDVYSSSQWMSATQVAIADCLKLPESRVQLFVRRVGGGFGCKISRSIQTACACAVVAALRNVPCRFVLPLQTNMATAGKRLPCQADYEVGVDDKGKTQYLKMMIVEDDGCSRNENIISYTLGGIPNSYDSRSWDVRTATVLTDLPGNTFMRAPGTFEGISTTENIMEHIARSLNKDSIEVKMANLKSDSGLRDIVKEFLIDKDYETRKKAIQNFNKRNRWMKKAIKVSLMDFPIIYYGNYTAQVAIYRGDGTVTVTTGGIEMGQGVNTKAAQICAYTLGIPVDFVNVIPSYSFIGANDVFSGSSIVSECVTYCIIKACNRIKERLEPLRRQMNNPTWEELIARAGTELIDLTETYMMTDKEPDLRSYSAYGVAILELQLDVLTGQHQILRVDLLEDVGLSMNPNVDVGQVEGAYVQGLGYWLSERLIYDEHTGKLLTNRSWNYFVPLALDIPIEFNVKLRYNSTNPDGVLSSKAVGEVCIGLSNGVTHALRDCIMEARRDSGCDFSEWLQIPTPFDIERIVLALGTKVSELVLRPPAPQNF